MVGDINMFLLGDVFLRNFYSVYDFQKQMVRLAVNVNAASYAGIGNPIPIGVIFLTYTLVCLGVILLSILALKLILKKNHKGMLERVHNQILLEENARGKCAEQQALIMNGISSASSVSEA